ncbi:hypothetical protein FPV67DRAFT_1562435 [Lyophyllum atratum]|nr:hypothetical protein FPV67DRAFT_1562435 [Lyophyllum atratum]
MSTHSTTSFRSVVGIHSRLCAASGRSFVGNPILSCPVRSASESQMIYSSRRLPTSAHNLSSSDLGLRSTRPPDSNSKPDPSDRPQISDQDWEIRTGRAIYVLQQTLPEFFLEGLVTSNDKDTGSPKSAAASVPVLNANPLDSQTYREEGVEVIYSAKIRLSYTPPVALPPPFPTTLHIEGLPMYLTSAVFIRHTLNALYSDLNVELRKVIVKTPRSKQSVSGEVTLEEPKQPSHLAQRGREKSLLVGFCVTGKSRVSGARGQWEVNSTYSFSPNTGLIDRHIIDSIYPPPHQAVYDSLRMSFGKVFGLGMEERARARSNGAACGVAGADGDGRDR